MTMTYNILSDPLFFIFSFFGLFVFIFKYNRYSEIFSGGIKSGKEVYDSDYLYILVSTLITFYPIYAIITIIFNESVIEFSILSLTVYFTISTLIVGIIYTIAYSPVWYNTVANKNYDAILGLLVSLMFGCFFATYIVVGLNPSTDAIRYVFGYHLNLALDILTFISTLAILPLIQRVIEYTYFIFNNNLMVALRGSLFAAVAGLVGFGTLLAMIPLFTSSMIAGSFGGLLLRNNIQYAPAPFLAIIAVLGVPPFWHTFYEFMSFALIAGSVGLLTYSFVTRNNQQTRYAVSGIILGSGILMFGAFTEVTVSTTFASIIRGYLSFASVISDISIDGGYIMAVIFTMISVVFMILLITYFIELVIRLAREVVT